MGVSGLIGGSMGLTLVVLSASGLDFDVRGLFSNPIVVAWGKAAQDGVHGLFWFWHLKVKSVGENALLKRRCCGPQCEYDDTRMYCCEAVLDCTLTSILLWECWSISKLCRISIEIKSV